ncbi:MAG TPA: WD40 repeat domain-containing protein, partial [Patescibacteria group bacterium]|nr:WD40 repeat domain-containing protein [Patescibacteria group bacterium]
MKLLFIFLFSAITVCAQVPEWSRKYHTGSVTCLDFSSDGKLLLSGGEDGQIFLNDVIRGLDIRSYPPTQFGAITSLHFSSDGRQFIASAIKYHDGQKFGSPACLKANIQGQDPLQLLFKPDNLLYNDNGKDIRELNNIDRLQMYLLGDSIICVLMSGEITGTKENSTYKGQGGLVHLYSASTGMKKKEVLKETLAFDVISASADLRRIYVAGKYSLLTLDSVGGITRNLGDSFKGSFIYNIQEEYSQKDAFPVFHGSWIEQASFIENGLLIQNTNGYIYTKGINQDTSRMEIPNVSSPTSLATVLATDIKGTFYITAHHDSTLRLWSPGVRNIFKKILLPSPVTAIAISSDSIHFATGHSDGTLALWNIDSLSGYAVTDSVFTPVIARVSGYYTYCVGENAKFDVIAQSNFGEEL